MPFARSLGPRSTRKAALGALVGLAALAVAGCAAAPNGLMPPDAATSQGQQIHNLYTIVFVVAVIIFVIVEGLIIWSVIRYRRKSDELPPQIHGNNTLEIVWTAIPMAIVAILFFLSWQTLNTVDATSSNPALRINVTGFQWQWMFQYPTANVTIIGEAGSPPVLEVPVGETVELHLKSQDVIHAFYVPQFLFKRDVVPGRENVFDFTVSQPGDYRGQCAEFCGLGHDGMLFVVRAVTPAQFNAWLAAQKNPPTPSPAASAAPGASASAGAGGGAATGPTLALTAANISYDKSSLSAPANTSFKIAFTNNDAGVPHNVSIHKGSSTGTEVWKGTIVTGPTSITYTVPALPAGTYSFVCSVHPNMTGTLTIQ